MQGVAFDMESPGGASLGTGATCVQSIVGCQFAAGCADIKRGTFTLDFGRGSVTGPIVLREMWLTDARVLQIDNGAISSGTGDFAGASGSVTCAGLIQYTAGGALPSVGCAVTLR